MSVKLELAGAVRQPQSFDLTSLSALPGQIDDVSSIAPGRQGTAVRLSTLLDAAGATADARYITVEAEEGYSASVPLDAIAEHAVVIYKQDGAPIPAAQGGPLRFLIPDAAACKTAEVDTCANVKHLSRIVLSAGPGKDTRPRTRRQHTDLHAAESA